MLRTLHSPELQRHPICRALCTHRILPHLPCFNTVDPAPRAHKGFSDSLSDDRGRDQPRGCGRRVEEGPWFHLGVSIKDCEGERGS